MKKLRAGFSLVEILVVVALIGILSSILYINVSEGTAQSRDAQRQADVRTVQTAIELYKNKYGRYPEGCNAAPNWSGHAPAHSCASGNQYILGLAPEFIPRLPQDPKLNGNNSGYAYRTNSDGSVYKFVALRTVETEVVTYDHEFRFCDYYNGATANESLCLNVASMGNNLPAHCRDNNSTFRTSYAVWGGFFVPNLRVTHANYDTLVERGTEDIICTAP